MDVGQNIDILEEYSFIFSNPDCRNAKRFQPLDLLGADGNFKTFERRKAHYWKSSLAAVPSLEGLYFYLEKNLDLTPIDFSKLLQVEFYLNVFAYDHEHLRTDIKVLKRVLCLYKHRVKAMFREVLQSDFISSWIYWNKCKTVASMLKSVILMVQDSFILLYDIFTWRRCIYRTTVNSGGASTQVTGSMCHPVFAYAENGIFFPNIFIVSYPFLDTVSKLRDSTKGRYIGLSFSFKKTLITLKLRQTNNGYRFILWNWPICVKLIVYEEESSKDLHSDSVLFHWSEKVGVGLFIQRNTTYQDNRATNVLHITVLKHKTFEKLIVLHKVKEKFFHGFTPGDICFSEDSKMYILSTKGDLYELVGFMECKLYLRKRWTRNERVNRPECPVKLFNYKDGLIIYGPQGIIKMYSMDSKKEWHCNWWMDLYDTGAHCLSLFGSLDFLYLLYPDNGLLRLKEDHHFEMVYKLDKIHITDMILIQPAGVHALAICDRRTIQVLRVSDGLVIDIISFPPSFDKYPFLVSSGYPYIIFISDRVGKLYIYDISDFRNPYVANEIKISPNRITKAMFTSEGMLLTVFVGSIGMNFIYWAAKSDDKYSGFKVFLSFPSDEPVLVCPYANQNGETYILLMEKKQPHQIGNDVFIYKFPGKQFIGVVNLGDTYSQLHFTWIIGNYIFASRAANKNILDRFSFKMIKRGGKTKVEVSKVSKIHQLSHLGAFEIIFGYRSIYSYGLEDGLLAIYQTDEKVEIKRIFSAYLHRGIIINYEANRYGNGGIRRCFISRCGGQILVLAQNGMLTTHKFRKMAMVPRSNEFYYKNLFRNIELAPVESCISLSLPAKNRTVFRIDKEIRVLHLRHQDRTGNQQELSPDSGWALIYGTRFWLNLVPETPSIVEDTPEEIEVEQPTAQTRRLSELKIKLIRKSITQSFWHIQYTLLQLLREHYRNERMSLPFTLFIIDRRVLREFFTHLEYIEKYTEVDIKRKIIRKMKKLYNYVSVLRKPFYNAELVRGILNPEICSYTIGRRVTSDEVKLERLCKIQWHERKVLNCGYCEARVFPLHRKLQKKIEVNKTEYPELTCLRTPEVLHITKIKEEEPIRNMEISGIHRLITETMYEKDLRYALEYYKTHALLKSSQQNTGMKIIDYDGIWKSLCTPKTYETLEAMERAIGKGIDGDEERSKFQRAPRYFLENLLKSSTGNFYEIKNRLVCKNCRKIPAYPKCNHNPKCYPCFHVLRCPLNKHVFCSTTVIVRDPNVPDNIFWKPLRDLSDYKFTLHPHAQSCSLELDKDYVIANPHLEPSLRHQLNSMFNKGRDGNSRPNELGKIKCSKECKADDDALPSTPSDETKEMALHSDKLWDDYLNESIEIVNRAEDIEALFRELFFKGSRCLLCKDDKQYLLIKELKHFMNFTPFFPLHTFLALPWLTELLKQIKQLRTISKQDDDYDKMLKEFPEILDYKKDEYFDSFMIPDWDDELIKMIAGFRKRLNLKLAKVYVMYSTKDLVNDVDNVNSEVSFGSEIAKSPADVICGYKEVSPDEVTDAPLNFMTDKTQNRILKTFYPTSDKMMAKIYDKQLKSLVLRPLNEGSVVDPTVAYYLSKKQPLKLLLTRDYEPPKLFKTDSEADLCPPWFTEYNDEKLSIVKSARTGTQHIPYDCFDDWQSPARSTMLPLRFMLKCNSFRPMYPLYRPVVNEKGTLDLFNINGVMYSAVQQKNLSDPFVPFQPFSANAKKWRPLTLKFLLDSKKPLPIQLKQNIKRLLTEELPPDCFHWLKSLVKTLTKLRDLVENKFSSNKFQDISRLHHEDYQKQQELYYSIEPIETARWIALLIHKLTVINNDVIDNAQRILSFYTSSNTYPKNSFQFTKKDYTSEGPSYDPRQALKAGFSARFSANDNKNLLDELKRTDLLFYDHKIFQPDGELRDLMYEPKENKEYQLRLMINKKLLQLSASLADLNNAPKSWFEWNPIQQGAPNWILLLSTAFGVQLFCCTLNNIQRRLYQIIQDTRSYIAPKVPKKRRKRVKVYERLDSNAGLKVKPLSSEVQLVNVTIKQLRMGKQRIRPEKHILRIGSGKPKGITNYEKILKSHKGVNEMNHPRKLSERRLLMQDKVKEMVTGDDQGRQMLLEQRKCWFEYFSTKPLHAGLPPESRVVRKKQKSAWPDENVWDYLLSPVRRFMSFLKEYPTSVKVSSNYEKDYVPIAMTREESEARKKKEIFFMKMLILDGPIARYTSLNNYYCNRFEYFLPMKSNELNAIVSLTTSKVLDERYRIIKNVRHLKHNVINIMLVIHLRKQQLKRQLAFFCENYDFKCTHYKRQIKLIPDEKMNYLYGVDDEDNIYNKRGTLKKQPPDKLFEYEPKFELSYMEEAVIQMMESSIRNTYMGILRRPPFRIKAENLDEMGSLTVRQRKKLERYSKKLILLERERDIVVMEFKTKLGWFSVYEQWFKWSFDYTLAYYGVFQLNGMESAIKAEERKANQIKKMKWEIRKIIHNMNEIRRNYLKVTTEYLYMRTAILADIQFFKCLKAEIGKLHDRIAELDAQQGMLKVRILRENPYLKETTLDKLLNPIISLGLLKDASVQELVDGYKFYYQRKKPVHYFYELHPQIGEYYKQVRNLNDPRLYPLMGYQLRKEVIGVRTEKQLLYYKLHTGHKRAEEFHARLKKTYAFIKGVLRSLIKLHVTCYEKLVLLKQIMHQQNMTVTVYRRNLEKPLMELIQPMLEGKEVRFFAIPHQVRHPKIVRMRHLRKFKESLIGDRIYEIFAIRKTVIAEIKLKKLYLTLMKMQFVRYLDGTYEDVIKHYRDYKDTRGNSVITTQIKGYDKEVQKIHLKQLIFNYLEHVKKEKKKDEKKKTKEHDQKWYCPVPSVRKAWNISNTKSLSVKHSNLCHHFGLMAWLIKNLWDVSDYEEAYTKRASIFAETDDEELVDTVGECSPSSHINKVLDFLHQMITPRVPPPSPANSDSLPTPVRMMLAAKLDSAGLAFQQDMIIYEYLKQQLLSFIKSLKERNMSLKDDNTKREIEISFKKWIAKLFGNWHIRVPVNRMVNINEAACSLLDTSVTNPETENVEQLLAALIQNHSQTLALRNIDRVKSDIGFTEYENKLTKCTEELRELPPLFIREKELTDEESGTEKECMLTVYAKFEGEQEGKLSNQQSLLILNLINEHIKKYNKDVLFPRKECKHDQSFRADLLKDWIAYAFGEVFLLPVQYVFIRAGDRLIKMYDAMQKAIKVKCVKTKKIKAREAVLSFLEDYGKYDESYRLVNQFIKEGECERRTVREPLLKKIGNLSRKLEKLRKANRRLEKILEKEKRRVFPMFGKEIVPINLELGKLFLSS